MIPPKSFFAFFLAITCLQATMHPAKVTPVELSNSNQEPAKQCIAQLDTALTELTARFPDNITQEEFDQIVDSSFKKFYEYIAATKPKAQVHVIIMYLQYAELIFKHGATSQQLQLKDHATKEAFFYQFLATWENMLGEALDSMTQSLHTVIVKQKE